MAWRLVYYYPACIHHHHHHHHLHYSCWPLRPKRRESEALNKARQPSFLCSVILGELCHYNNVGLSASDAKVILRIRPLSLDWKERGQAAVVAVAASYTQPSPASQANLGVSSAGKVA